MKRFITALGLVIPVVVLVFAVFYGFVVYQGAGVDEESKAYIDLVTPLILEAMDRQTFFKYADDVLIKSLEPEKFDRMFSIYKSLGKLRSYDGCAGKASVKISVSGVSFTADYQAKASFDKGEARLRVLLVRRGETWRISGFGISSPALDQLDL